MVNCGDLEYYFHEGDKLLELNYTAEIYAKCHLTNKLLNYNLIIDREMLHKLGTIFNYKNKTIIWKEVLISLKPPNYKANKFDK